ncbi:MAG: tryptophan-rich sensory protein [Cyanophyceae cyanobacterium]
MTPSQYLSMNSRDTVRQILTLAAILAAIIVNTVTNLAPPSGQNVGEIANTILQPVLIIPANYAFAIWGVIYLGLICLAVYQALPAQKRKPNLRKLDHLLVIASLAQIVWIFLFSYQLFALSIVAMLLILIPLIVLYLRLGIGVERVHRQEKWFVNIPVSIYLAWISVATIVNVASALYISNWNGWGLSDEVWTVVMLVVAALIGATVAVQRRDLAFVLVFAWAFVAIAVANLSIVTIAATGIGLAVVLILLGLFRQGRRRSMQPQ